MMGRLGERAGLAADDQKKQLTGLKGAGSRTPLGVAGPSQGSDRGADDGSRWPRRIGVWG